MKNYLNTIQKDVVYEEPEEQANHSIVQDKKKDHSHQSNLQKKSTINFSDSGYRPQQNIPQQNQHNPGFQFKVEPPKVIGLNLDEKENMLEKILKELNFPLEFPNYSSKDYWNNRYQHEQNEFFEWLQPYSILQGKFTSSTTLYIGCGNSKVGEEMANDGIHNIFCLDFSDVVIREMNLKSRNPNVTYDIMDVCEKIEFPNNSVDLIVDKGLLDAILCGEGFFERLKNMLSECWRALKPKGTLMILSQGHPDTRVLYLKNKQQPFQLNIQELKKVSIPSFAALDDLQYHYLYICTKI